MRSLEYLIQLFPDKTGKEILEIQEQDRIEADRELEELHKEDLKLIEDINSNGGYYKGKFGATQHYYYNFSNLRLEHNAIICDVEKIVCFDNDEITIEIKTRDYQDFNKFGIGMCERITKEDYEKISDYLRNIFKKFW